MIYDYLILGGGIVGTSIARHLALLGGGRIVVLERESTLGFGSTGRATGGFRAQFGTEINIQLSLLTRAKLLNFSDETGVDCGYSPCGYIFMAGDEQQMGEMRRSLHLQHQVGLHESREVRPDEIARLNSAVNTEGLVGGTFCPTDGFIRPLDILRGYFKDALRRNVEYVFGCGQTELLINRDGPRPRVNGVRTTGRGEIRAGCVINAAGAFAAGVHTDHEFSVPVRPERRQVAITEPFAELPDTMPLTIDCTDGFHLRVREGRVLLLKPNETSGTDPFDTTFDWDWLPDMLRSAQRRIPCLKRATISRSWSRAGLYEMSPDKHAIVGRHPEGDGYYLAVGNSGHGVMHSPAIGQLLAEELVFGAARTLSLHPLRPDRFAENDLLPVLGVI